MKKYSLIRKTTIAMASAFLASGVMAPAQAATSIDTTGGTFVANITPFGVTDTSTYGQTFTVGSDNSLDSFTMYLNGAAGAAIKFKSYVYAWDGAKATGSALYSSALQTFSGGGTTAFAFDTSGLKLQSGSRYVAFLSTAGLQAGQPQNTYAMPLVTSNTYSGGDFVFYNAGDNFAALTNSKWDCAECGFGDAFFKASLSAGAVPEPATWAMMILGMGAVGFAMRRSRKTKINTTVSFA